MSFKCGYGCDQSYPTSAEVQVEIMCRLVSDVTRTSSSKMIYKIFDHTTNINFYLYVFTILLRIGRQ